MDEHRHNSAHEGLAFSFAEMLREIEHMLQLAAPFLERTTRHAVIPEWRDTLKRFHSDPRSGHLCWQISKQRPIRTERSEGAYQPDGKGGRCVVGELSAIWEIKCARPPKKKRSARIEQFVVTGNASTQIRVLEVAEEQNGLPEIARWTFDIGAKDAPGCHFHTQIGWGTHGEDSPPRIDVPRFPNIFVTPMDALEFLLGELFQEQWTQHATRAATSSGWRGIQKKRLRRLLGWYQREISEAGGSPWTSFKGSKPPQDVLTGEPA